MEVLVRILLDLGLRQRMGQANQAKVVVALAFLIALSMTLAGWFDMEVWGRNVLYFDREFRRWQPPVTVPNLGWAAFLVLTPTLAFVTRMVNKPDGVTAYSLTVLCGLVTLTGIVTWTGALDQTAVAVYVVPYLLLLGLQGWELVSRGPTEHQRKVWMGFALAGILAWGLGSRLEELAWAVHVPPMPDAVYYRHVAQAMSTPYDTGAREPLWLWVIRGWLWLIGDSTHSLRVLTLCLSVGLMGVAYKVFRDYTGRPVVGLLVALLLSQHPFLIRLSVMGLREEAYMIALLCFIYLVFVPNQRWSVRRQAIALGVAGAALLLLRLNSVVFVVPLLLLWARRRSVWEGPMSWLRVTLVVGFLVAVTTPHLIHNDRLYGDPFYSVNRHAVAARNIEFVLLKSSGCAGCPTVEEVGRDLYAGAPVTTGEYLFEMHGPRELAMGLAKGYRDLYVLPSDLFRRLVGTELPFIAYGFFLVGLGLLLVGPYREMLLVIVLVGNAIPFFLEYAILDLRIGIHLVPFVSFVLAHGIWQCLEWSNRVRLSVGWGRLGALPAR